jgi:hypothetical protein
MAKARKKSNRGTGRTPKKAMPRSKGMRYDPKSRGMVDGVDAVDIYLWSLERGRRLD